MRSAWLKMKFLVLFLRLRLWQTLQPRHHLFFQLNCVKMLISRYVICVISSRQQAASRSWPGSWDLHHRQLIHIPWMHGHNGECMWKKWEDSQAWPVSLAWSSRSRLHTPKQIQLCTPTHAAECRVLSALCAFCGKLKDKTHRAGSCRSKHFANRLQLVSPSCDLFILPLGSRISSSCDSGSLCGCTDHRMGNTRALPCHWFIYAQFIAVYTCICVWQETTLQKYRNFALARKDLILFFPMRVNVST